MECYGSDARKRKFKQIAAVWRQARTLTGRPEKIEARHDESGEQ